MIKKDFVEAIGNTPLIRVNSLSNLTGCEIYGKAEMMNPGGSIKDRAALGMIIDAEKRGILKPGMLIVEGTAGNTGIGLALIGNARGYRTKFVVPSSQAQEKIDTLRGMGAEVLVVPPAIFPAEGHFRKVAERVAKEEGGYYINQFDNPSNYKEHYRTTAPEIWEDTHGKINSFVCAIGSGGTLAGVSMYLKEKNPAVKIGCVDPVGSSMFNYFSKGKAELTPGESISEGIGQAAVTENVLPAKVDYSYSLDDQTIVNMVHYIVQRDGLFLGSSSGANLCGAYLMAKKLGPGNTIVTILCDSGQKYISKVYNEKFLASKNLTVSTDPKDIFPKLNALL